MLDRVRGFYLIFVIGAAFLATRAVLDSDFRNSTLLYLLIPFGISILLHLVTPATEDSGPLGRHLRDSTIVFLATSAFLFEGFICVLFFMPIYYLVVLVGFAFSSLLSSDDGDGGSASAYAIPLAVLLLASEGLTEPTTVQRYREATHVAVVDGSIDQLKENMAKPIAFTRERPWFLRVFPLPTRIEAGTLAAGDVHRLHFVYRRWFFTNVHRGDMKIHILEVAPKRIRTRITDDSSYLSHYMRIEGTEVRFAEAGPGRTRVSLTVKYHRLLDPYWYFGPLQQVAAEQSARYLIESIIARKAGAA